MVMSRRSGCAALADAAACERAKQILEELADAERGLTTQKGVASGRLHVSAPSLLGRMRLAPMLPGCLAEQTRVSIDLMLVDRPVRLAEEGIDVALRIGPLEDSGLIVRNLDDPACYAFSVIAKVIPGREEHLYNQAKVMEKAIADDPSTLSILKCLSENLLSH
jgi:DNA-binding transcriptional LysR family regulator